ncbi:hypothetical protein BT96DRAFT_1103969 [Gymnopus androsaceus JB14]|uniref:ABC transporter domain-containing protein n=1 Tax=Gymnopus androsaceus JB14 TaxID=1447944 RepID=A0A6A4GEG0_9AGAR|nr:hypothetical protein BT96DRAFT_1103969 [Gymnopus androsaceus JB14]
MKVWKCLDYCFSETNLSFFLLGLNVEQRKRLTIGIELAAKPKLLLLDEPTSGLDSHVNWRIMARQFCALFISLRLYFSKDLIACYSWLVEVAPYTLGRLVQIRGR